MPDNNCGRIDLSKVSSDELITDITFNNDTTSGTAYIRCEVDENLVVVLPGRSGDVPAGVYAIIKFNEGCYVDVCGDAADFNRALSGLANYLETSLKTETGATPTPQQAPAFVKQADNNPPTNSRPSGSNSGCGDKRPTTPSVCGVNVEKLTIAQNRLDLGETNIHGFQPSAIFPNKVNIPLRNNRWRYGPWKTANFDNVKGAADVVINTDLCPWNFGDFATMTKAGNALVNNLATGLSKAETGSVTVPGLPQLARLGAAVNNGPLLSNMSVSFGSSGITTTYEFRTFNPKVGGITRMSVERFKELREARQQQLKLLKSDQINQYRISQKINRIRNQFQREAERHARVADQASLQRVMVGEIYNFSMETEDTSKLGQRTVVGMSTLAKSVAEMVYDYERKAYMSLDGLFGPISKNGGGTNNDGSFYLPQYASYDSDGTYITSSHKASPISPQPPFIKNGGCNDTNLTYTVYNLDLSQNYFDPLTNKFETHTYHAGAGAGHVIDMLGREAELHEEGLITNFFKTTDSKRYSDDYRFLALRGPLMLHSWGYDLDGKPIPNEADTIEETKMGNFKVDHLKDRFMKDWLQKPFSWPAAPVDLRFDRKRGVWVSPQPYKIVVAKIVKEVPAFGQGLGVLVNYGNKLYDADGNEINADPGTEDSICCETLTGGGACSVGNWIDVVTNVCLTPSGLAIKKVKVRVLDAEYDDCCTVTIPTESCSSSTGGNSNCDCFTVDCSSSSSSSSSSCTQSTDMNLIEIVDRIGHRHKAGCYVYAYYDTTTAKYIVLQN